MQLALPGLEKCLRQDGAQALGQCQKSPERQADPWTSAQLQQQKSHSIARAWMGPWRMRFRGG